MSSHESETRTRILQATWQLMEQQYGKGVRMADIAQAAGISRQAVYLHFGSRADLLIATTRYGDEVLGLDDRLVRWRAAITGVERLAAFVEFWGHYIPEIYGIARALLAVRDTDQAAALAWEDRMNAVKDGCRTSIEMLERDGMLAAEWTIVEATDMFWMLLSIRNWEQLTRECGWSSDAYVTGMQKLVKRTFVCQPPVD